MTFGESITTCLSKYATFTGRASRSEYWWFYLFNLLVSIAASIFDAIAFSSQPVTYFLATLALIIPNIAVVARRLHDSERSGWWMLIPLTVIGIPFFVYWILKKGDPTTNKYGDAVISDQQTNSTPSRFANATNITSDKLDVIARLHEMKEKGIISEEEFQRKKSSML